MLAAIEGALLLDILFNGRWILHQFFVDFAASQGVYEFRRAPQVIFLVLLVAILVSAITSILRRFRSQISLGAAIVGVLVSLGTWSVEVVSLHQVDAVLYHTVGRIMVVSLVWCAACATTSIGVLLSTPGVVRHD
jgi:hypothetical protein